MADSQMSDQDTETQQQNEMASEMITDEKEGWSAGAQLALMNSQTRKDTKNAWHAVVPFLHSLHLATHIKDDKAGYDAVRNYYRKLLKRLEKNIKARKFTPSKKGLTKEERAEEMIVWEKTEAKKVSNWETMQKLRQRILQEEVLQDSADNPATEEDAISEQMTNAGTLF
eukprot:TRINITY_DN62_c0_g1_i1.p1 TRINITY_DN62_c0_g1~~TRINITY_DN62_c0_g1_i1.p1  ORF type:complete len:170 (-),score=43.44 TRINITY_DN62_c0_g1_i1:368-877(-)